MTTRQKSNKAYWQRQTGAKGRFFSNFDKQGKNRVKPQQGKNAPKVSFWLNFAPYLHPVEKKNAVNL